MMKVSVFRCQLGALDRIKSNKWQGLKEKAVALARQLIAQR